MEGVNSFTIEVDIEIELEETIDDVVDLTSENEEEDAPINIQFKPDYVLEKNRDELILLCTQCNTKFIFAITFFKHLVHHELEKRKEAKTSLTFMCELCGQVSTSFDMFNLHQKRHSQSFECKKCARVFDSRLALKCHELTNTCLYLVEDFTRIKTDSNKKNCLNKIGAKTNVVKQKSIEGTKPDGLQCKTCQQIFSDKEELIEHKHNSHNCSEAECNICYGKFPTKYLMYRHKIVEHCERRFECNKCKSKFTCNKSLKRHQIHYCKFYVSGNYYFCDVCSKRAKTRKEIHRHIQSIHCPPHSVNKKVK